MNTSANPSGRVWRINERCSALWPEKTYYDLYENTEYSSIWICHEHKSNTWTLNHPGQVLGPFASFQEAEEHVVTLAVIRRFQWAGTQ